MQKKMLVLIMMLCVHYTVFGQRHYIPSPAAQPDTATYNHYKTLLNASFHLDSLKPSSVNKHNIFVSYGWLNAPIDTIFKFVYQSLMYDPIDECETSCKLPSYTYSDYIKRYPKEWKKVCQYCDSIHGTFNRGLMDTLKIISENDQKYRKDVSLGDYLNSNNANKQADLDSENLRLIEAIFKMYGYPGKQLVGIELSEVAFMVIQHAPSEKQQLHLPTIEKAVKDKRLYKYYLPYLIDRIRMGQHLPQVYGTQLVWNKKKNKQELYPIEDAKNVDIRREEMNLGDLKDYLKKNNVDSVIRE